MAYAETVLRCPACGFESPPGLRFCGRLRRSAPPQRHGAHGAAGEERKVVTVLFCDLVGFTSRSDQADPEDVGAMLRPYSHPVARRDRAGRRHPRQLIGDAVMAVFGARRSHEDDPERGCVGARDARCDCRAEPGLPHSSWRCASASTPARHWSPSRPAPAARAWSRDVVNTASRLQAASPRSTGWSSGEATWRATQTLPRVRAARARPASRARLSRGPIWRVAGARSRSECGPGRRPATPLIGRGAELAALHDAVPARPSASTPFRSSSPRSASQESASPGSFDEFASHSRCPSRNRWPARGPAASPSASSSPSGRWARSSRPRRASWSRTRPRGREPSSWTPRRRRGSDDPSEREWLKRTARPAGRARDRRGGVREPRRVVHGVAAVLPGARRQGP